MWNTYGGTDGVKNLHYIFKLQFFQPKVKPGNTWMHYCRKSSTYKPSHSATFLASFLLLVFLCGSKTINWNHFLSSFHCLMLEENFQYVNFQFSDSNSAIIIKRVGMGISQPEIFLSNVTHSCLLRPHIRFSIFFLILSLCPPSIASLTQQKY